MKKLSNSIHSIAKWLPDPLMNSLKQNIYRLPRLSELRTFYNRSFVDAYVFSYPKCGRTWLRVLLARTIELQYGLEFVPEEYLELKQVYERYSAQYPSIPLIDITHDDNPHHKTVAEIETDKSKYRWSKVVLLVRDPRDVVVSNYFEYTKRKGKDYAGDSDYQGDLISYMDYEIGGIDNIIQFYNVWAKNRHIPRGFLLLRYEDLKRDPKNELGNVLNFLGVPYTEALVDDAVRYASFSNMRKMEITNALNSGRLFPGDMNDPESYKTRRGVVGGYIDYLDDQSISHLNQKICDELDPYFGYC